MCTTCPRGTQFRSAFLELEFCVSVARSAWQLKIPTSNKFSDFSCSKRPCSVQGHPHRPHSEGAPSKQTLDSGCVFISRRSHLPCNATSRNWVSVLDSEYKFCAFISWDQAGGVWHSFGISKRAGMFVEFHQQAFAVR